MAEGIPVVRVSGGIDTNLVADSKINVSAQPYEDAISRGDVTGKEDFNKYGANNDVGTTIEDVWITGGTKSYLAAGEQLKVVSTSTDDDGAPVGIGARTVTIYGLDDNHLEISETLTMDGTTAVTSVETYLHVYRLKVMVSGTSLSNVGTITIKNNASTVTLATISPGYGQTLMTHYTVPANKQMLIKNLVMTATGTKDVTVFLFVRPFGESWQVKLTATLNNHTFNRVFAPPMLVDAKSDVVVRAISVQAGAIVDAGWDSILETTP